MKKILVAILSITLILNVIISKAQTLDFAINLGGQNFDVGNSIVTDNMGNSYSTGTFSGVATFGNFTLTAYQGSAYIVKTNSTGYTQWANYFSSNDATHGKSIAIDNNGYLYVTGYFYGTVDFDPSIGVTNLTSSGNSDVFVLKMDTLGNLIWAKNMGGLGNDESVSVKVDNAGNVYTVGKYMYDGDYDPSNNVYTLTYSGNTGYLNMFISKLDNSGNFVWAKSINQMGNINPTSMDIDALGNVYTTGEYSGIIDFDPGVNVYNIISQFNASCFMLKLNSNGGFVTVKNFTNSGTSNGIKIDNNSNIYITGYFLGPDDFDPDSLTNYTLNSMGFMDVFILKLNSSGNFIWAKSFGGTGYDQSFGITTDNFNNVYTTGLFSFTVDFDPNVGVYNLSETTQNGQGDVFVSKLDSMGNFEWAASWGGNSYDQGNSISINSNGYVVSTGYFSLLCDFDPSSTAFFNLYGDYSDAYISSLGNMTNLFVNACSNQLPYIFNNQNIVNSGVYYDTLINSNNGDSIIKLTLTINSINLNVTQAGAILSSNESGATYQWLSCPLFSIIPGATGQTYSATSNGNYAVGIAKNGCIDTSSCYTVAGLGNNDINLLSDFSIVPNPTNGIFTISTQLIYSNAEVYVFNSVGQKILSQFIHNHNAIIDITNFANGIYYIEILSGNKSFRTKVVKN